MFELSYRMSLMGPETSQRHHPGAQAIIGELDDAASANNAGLEALCDADPIRARQHFRRAFCHDPSQLGLLVNYGLALHQCGRIEAAERSYQLAIGQEDCRGAALKNLGFLKVWQRQGAQGWALHRQRFQSPSLMERQWQGEACLQGPLLIWNDVGQGDALQFSRYLPLLAEQGLEIQFAVQPELVSLFQRSLPAALRVVDRNTAPWEQAPQHLPLMGLMGLLDPELTWGATFTLPYLRGCLKGRVEPKPSTSKLRLGLCWASNRDDKALFRSKSLPLADLLNHPEWQQGLDGVELVSLQRGEPDDHQRWGHRFSAQLPSTAGWLETADWIERCDWVLSVDTAVAHLAGALGKPVIVLLPWMPDWRWRYGQPGQCWYRHCWTAAQPSSGDWIGALRLARQLAGAAGLLPADPAAK